MKAGVRIGIAVAALTLLSCALLATSATASIDAFGNVHGRDKTILRNHFLALHPRNYRIVGYHASVFYRFKYAGVYYLQRAHGANVLAGVAIYHHLGTSWRLIAHPSKRLQVNLDPDGFYYSASFSGGGEYRMHEGNALDDPGNESITDTDIHFQLVGKLGAVHHPLELVGYQEQPEPPTPKNIVTGSGKTSYSRPVSSEDTPVCEYSIANYGSSGAEVSLGWQGKSLAVRVDLGEPGGGAGTNCGGQIQDPKSSDPGVEFTSVLPKTPLGKPFTVPLELDHRRDEAETNPETGALASVYERSLTLKGALQFHLVGLEVPRLN